MARSNSNRLVEDLGTARRDTTGSVGPGVESANARVDMLGPFRRANLAINLSAVQLTAGGVDADAPTGVLAHSPGKIIGIAYKMSANVTAGGATAAQVQASVAPAATLTAAAQGDAAAIASGGSLAQTGVIDMTTSALPSEIAFSKGDVLGLQLSTSGTFAPTTADFDAYLIVRWAPSPA